MTNDNRPDTSKHRTIMVVPGSGGWIMKIRGVRGFGLYTDAKALTTDHLAYLNDATKTPWDGKPTMPEKPQMVVKPQVTTKPTT